MLESEFVPLFGGRKVQIYRAGRGPTIVWLHGPHGVRRSDPVIAELAKRCTVIAPVAPGFNDLDELDEIRDVHDLALHYDDLLDALGLDNVLLVGHSFGGMIAAELAAHVPKRVGKLVLISPIGLWRDDHPVADLFARPYLTIDTILWKAGEASGPMADPANLPNDPVERTVTIVQSLATVAKFIWPIPDKGLRRRLHRVTAETLVVFGADDQFVPAIYADEFAAAIAGARKAVIPDAAHMVPYEQTAEVVSLIEQQFAANVRAARSA
jgi:pimeloyl-ACP methyl ester carboxylesterase